MSEVKEINGVTLEYDPDEPIWAVKYRPRHVKDVVLPLNLKKQILKGIEENNLQSLILYGSPGRGKTSLAKAIVNDMNTSDLFINASLETSIDVIRNKVINFISTKSVFGADKRKVVINDECERLSLAAIQSLKGLMETFSEQALFIFTTNHYNQVPDALKSRCVSINFDEIPEDDKPTILQEIFKRTSAILTNEGVSFDPAVLATIIKNTFPDFRQLMNILQRGSVSGELDSSIVAYSGSYGDLIEILLEKKWTNMADWVAKNYQFFDFGTFYNEIRTKVPVQALPAIVLLTSEYDFKNSQVSDKMINITAFLTEVMKAL